MTHILHLQGKWTAEFTSRFWSEPTSWMSLCPYPPEPESMAEMCAKNVNRAPWSSVSSVCERGKEEAFWFIQVVFVILASTILLCILSISSPTHSNLFLRGEAAIQCTHGGKPSRSFLTSLPGACIEHPLRLGQWVEHSAYQSHGFQLPTQGAHNHASHRIWVPLALGVKDLGSFQKSAVSNQGCHSDPGLYLVIHILHPVIWKPQWEGLCDSST